MINLDSKREVLYKVLCKREGSWRATDREEDGRVEVGVSVI